MFGSFGVFQGRAFTTRIRLLGKKEFWRSLVQFSEISGWSGWDSSGRSAR